MSSASLRHALRLLSLALLLGATPALLGQHAGVAGGAHAAGGFGHGGFGHGAGGPGFGAHPAPLRNGVVGGFHFRHHRPGFYNPYYSPYLSSMYWWDNGDYPSDGQQAAPPPAVVVERAPAPQPVEQVKPANPLMIELQGDRFVRVKGDAASAATAAPSAAPALPPVLLVFRDGHQEQVFSYSIFGPALYASGSYWTNGYWTQKILLADLNLPATLRVNQERGVNFVLPSAPNQVITRP